jgi:hypothetical protein
MRGTESASQDRVKRQEFNQMTHDEELLELLTAVQWSGTEHRHGAPVMVCPECGHSPSQQHARDCALYKQITRLKRGKLKVDDAAEVVTTEGPIEIRCNGHGVTITPSKDVTLKLPSGAQRVKIRLP